MKQRDSSGDEEPLVDTTAAIPLRSKRTGRTQRKQAIRDRKQRAKPSLSNLPTEIVLEILKGVHPSDVFHFSYLNRRFHSLVTANANVIGDEIIKQLYSILVQCFPLPRLLSDLDPTIQEILIDPKRQQQLSIHYRPYRHVQPFDKHLICTCLTCILTWNNLGVVLDFAHWQDNLDAGEPIPLIPRGQNTQWNEDLVEQNARIIRLALKGSLWHARILETHLNSTVRSIRRQQGNTGNKRIHVDMTEEEASSGRDDFLSKYGPPVLEFPFDRDLYYMLEAYLPTRWWSSREKQWKYRIAGAHERDIEAITMTAIQNK